MAKNSPTWSYGTLKTFSDSGNQPHDVNSTWSYGVLIMLFERLLGVALNFTAKPKFFNFDAKNKVFNFNAEIRTFNFTAKPRV